MALTKRIVRIACTLPGIFPSSPWLAVNTERTPESVRANATRFEFGFFTAAGVAHSLTNVESLNLRIMPSQTDETEVLADQTVTSIDNTMAANTWADGSKQHAVFTFTNAEMNLEVGASSPKSLWLVVTAIMDDGTEYTFAGGVFLLHEDNNAAADPPPENPGTAITLEQADARYLPITAGDGDANGFMIVPNSEDGMELALWNETRSIYQILRITGAAGSETLTFTDIPE